MHVANCASRCWVISLASHSSRFMSSHDSASFDAEEASDDVPILPPTHFGTMLMGDSSHRLVLVMDPTIDLPKEEAEADFHKLNKSTSTLALHLAKLSVGTSWSEDLQARIVSMCNAESLMPKPTANCDDEDDTKGDGRCRYCCRWHRSCTNGSRLS